MRKNNIAQSTLEYAVIIAVVVAALLALQIYLKRGVQGKLRQSTDNIGEQFEANQTSASSFISTTGNTVQNITQGETKTTTSARTKEAASETVEGWGPGGSIVEPPHQGGS